MFEEAAIYILMIVIGSPAVASSSIRGEPIGEGPTLCLVLIMLGAVGLGQLMLRHRAARADLLTR